MSTNNSSESKKKQQTNIVDRTLNPKSKNEVSLAAFSFLFSELVQYCHKKSNSVKDLEKRLADVGYTVGIRLLEYVTWREKYNKKDKDRDNKIVKLLLFISTTVWKTLFNKEAVVEKNDKNQYMITESEPLVCKFISTPKEMSSLNCSSFVSGIVEGILDAADFPSKVSTFNVEIKGQRYPKTMIVIEFKPEVLERDIRVN